jgi:putative DNA primase/helicase
MLLIVGPRRSGKGTIGRILGDLVGTDNVAGPTTGGLADRFGLEPLRYKSLAIVSDARFTGSDIQSVVEKLLVISGEDTVTFDRKHTTAVTAKLPTRFVFLTNEIPRLRDSAGALTGRFLILTLRNSFFGQEDIRLTDRLRAELPGILVWALQGWERLNERGRFAVPESSQEAEKMLADLSSPVAAFVGECCRVGEGASVTVGALFAAWNDWCEAEGRDKPGTRQAFGRELAAVIPGLAMGRTRGDGRYYRGLCLDASVTPAPLADPGSPPT